MPSVFISFFQLDVVFFNTYIPFPKIPIVDIIMLQIRINMIFGASKLSLIANFV
ncbi:MAG: hypothetical protein ACTSXG_02485 [Alphaproteobacteria bacterium]